MRSSSLAVPLFVALGFVLSACGGPRTGVSHAGADGLPAVTAETYHELLRQYWRLDPDDPTRIAWRDALIGHLASGSTAILERGEYRAVVEHLAQLALLLSPADIDAGRVPADIAPVARWVIEHGSPRGDEGRVMGAHLLLAAIGEDADAHRREREEVSAWGREARAGIANPLERYGSLIQVWEQHEQIAPSSEVLETLARLYLEQREALRRTFGPESQGTPRHLSLRQLQIAPLLVQRAPLDVAAVFLRHGQIEQAVDHVRRMEPTQASEGELLSRLAQILERARENNDGGAAALEELAGGFARARPQISAAICRVGVRRFHDDARFPLCLARVAIEGDRAAAATSWYAQAVRLAPEDRAIYDEALRQFAELMQAGVLDAEAGQSRAIAGHALEILDEHESRWPDHDAPVSREDILLQIGRAEMSAGNIPEAQERLEASLEAHESRGAHIQLGLLLERVGRGDEAAVHYRAALDLTEGRDREGAAERAELTERLGNAFRRAGQDQQARRMYRQALEQWERVLEGMSGSRRALGLVRRGVLLSRVGDGTRSNEAFEAALEAAPSWREPYASILAHLVVSEPNLELAQRVLRRAQFQLHLEPQWRVYFALWVQTIAGRASAEPEHEVGLLLRDLADGREWTNRLAAFGHQTLAYPELVEHAEGRGQRAEATFYQGTRQLAAGDVAGARQRFEEVLESGMVNFYEYTMAQELLDLLPNDSGEVAESR